MEETAEIAATEVEATGVKPDDEVEGIGVAPAAEVSQGIVPRAEYDLHIKVPEEMRTVLFNATQLAYRLGDIPKPSLVNLMNLFIGWGLHVQKKRWLDHMGYH